MTYSQLVIAELKNNTLSKVTFEAIAVAKQLAPKEYIIGAIFGVKDMQSHAETLIKAGCDKCSLWSIRSLLERPQMHILRHCNLSLRNIQSKIFLWVIPHLDKC